MPSAQQQAQARTAWSQWNPSNYQAGIPKDLLDGILNQGWRASPDADYSGSVAQFGVEGGNGPNDPQRIVFHPQGQGPGEAYYTFDPTTGAYLSNETGSGIQSYASGVLSVLAAAAGGAALGGLGGAAGEAGAGAGAGVTGFGDAGAMYGGLDAAGAGTLGGGASVLGGSALPAGAGIGGTAVLGAGAGAGGGAGAGTAGGATAATPSTGGLGSSFVNALKSGASSLFGGGGAGTMDWTSLLSPALQALGGFATASAQKSAANTAANDQSNAALAGIATQQNEFNQVQQLLNPYVQAGYGSLKQQQDLSGANGPDAQQAAITALQQTPGFQSQLTLGENRILQNASATGGLRGGNVQGALAYFAPSMLAQTINDQYARLGGLTSIGQNAAAGVGNAGMQTGNSITGLQQQEGSAAAGAALAGGKAQSNLYSSLSGALGQYVGSGGSFGGFGGVTPDAIQGAYAQTSAGGSGFGTGSAYGNQDYGLFF